MKAFFWLTLVLSVALVPYQLFSDLRVFAHNKYSTRNWQLDATIKHDDHVNASFGLTPSEVAKLDEYAAIAYRSAVFDGYRLGIGYGWLSLQSLAVTALLFLSSIAGLRSLRKNDAVVRANSN